MLIRSGNTLYSPSMRLFLLVPLALVFTVCAPAQLKAPNANGVAMGAVQLTVRNIDADVNFFKLLGGTPVKNGSLQLIEFPGMYVELRRGDPSGGSVGSIINHFGFQVKSIQEWLPKWRAAGIKIEPITRPTQAFLLSPDGARIEILEDPALPEPIAGHHVHFFTPDVSAMRAWYVKTFCAVAGTRTGPAPNAKVFQTADLPGIDLSFSPSGSPVVPTKGRAISAIDFEVKDLKAFVATLRAMGIKVDEPYRRVPHSSVFEAAIVDPWGTTIVLSEGLSHFR